MTPEDYARYAHLLRILSERRASGGLIGRAVFSEAVRVFRAQDGRALFVASDVLSALGYQNLDSGVGQHLRRCPVPIARVKLKGKRGYPFASALDSIGVEWLIKKTRPRLRSVEVDEDVFDDNDQAEDVLAFTNSWNRCLSYLPEKSPIQYQDLEALRYTDQEKEMAKELQELGQKKAAHKVANGARNVWELVDGFGPYIVCSSILKDQGPWNLQGNGEAIPGLSNHSLLIP